MSNQSMRSVYNQKYQASDYFSYKHWMFAPYIQALIRKYNIPKDGRILDLGCGTGFFARLFSDAGMGKVVGIDLSEVGLSAANALGSGENLVVGDAADKLPFKAESFDLIFCRGFSPYNLEDFGTNTVVTRHLLRYLREKGLFIFAWSSDGGGSLKGARKRLIGKTDTSWINHTQDDIEQHFSTVDAAKFLDLFFLNRLELVCFGQYGLISVFNPITSFLTKVTGIRGEVICVLEKQGDAAHPSQFYNYSISHNAE